MVGAWAAWSDPSAVPWGDHLRSMTWPIYQSKNDNASQIVHKSKENYQHYVIRLPYCTNESNMISRKNNNNKLWFRKLKILQSGYGCGRLEAIALRLMFLSCFFLLLLWLWFWRQILQGSWRTFAETVPFFEGKTRWQGLSGFPGRGDRVVTGW